MYLVFAVAADIGVSKASTLSTAIVIERLTVL